MSAIDGYKDRVADCFCSHKAPAIILLIVGIAAATFGALALAGTFDPNGALGNLGSLLGKKISAGVMAGGVIFAGIGLMPLICKRGAGKTDVSTEQTGSGEKRGVTTGIPRRTGNGVGEDKGKDVPSNPPSGKNTNRDNLTFQLNDGETP